MAFLYSHPVAHRATTLVDFIMRINSLAASIFALACGTASGADSTLLENMVVTATRDEASIASLPMTVQVISRDDLLKQVSAGDNLSDALSKLVPGLGVATEVATEFSQNLRGRRVLYLIDGVPQRDNRNISRFLNTVAAQTVARVEVVANASAQYGVGGAGGIINIITRRGDAENQVDIGARALISDGELTDYAFSADLWGASERFDYLLSLNWEDRGAQFDASGQRIAPEPAQTSRLDAQSEAVFAKLGYQPDDASRIELSADYYKDEQDTDYGPNFGGPGIPALLQRQPTEAVAIAGLNLETQPESERVALQVTYTNDDFWGQNLQLQAYHREREYQFFPFPGLTNLALNPQYAALLGSPVAPVIYVNQSNSKARVQGLRSTVTSQLSDELDLIWGADWSRDRGEQTAWGYDLDTYIASGGLEFTPTAGSYAYGPDVTTESAAAFVNANWRPSRQWSVHAGLRFEQVIADIGSAVSPLETLFLRQYAPAVGQLQSVGLLPGTTEPASVAGGEIDDDQWLFNAGASYQFNEHHSVYVNYSQGFELPDYARLLRDGISADSVLNQLVQGVTPISIDDTELEAIEVDSVELGWRYGSPMISAGLAFFASESSKTTVFNDDYTVDMLDQDKQISGLEATGQWQVNSQWQLGASLAFTQGNTDEAGGDQALPVIEVSPVKGNVYVAWDRQQMGARLQMQWVDDDSRAQDDNPSQAEVEGYHTFDLLAHYQLPAGRVDVAVHNLANEDYQTVYSQWAEATYGSFAGIAAQGRTISLGYRVAF